MTSTPVRDVSSLMNFVQQKGVPVSGPPGSPGGFGDAMNRATGRMSERAVENAVKTDRTALPNGRKEVAAAKDHAESRQVQSANRESTASAEKTSTTAQEDEATMAKVDEAGMEAVRTVAEEMGLSEEEVLAAMEEMGLVPAALLDPRMLTELVLKLSGADALTLMTDGALYAKVSALTAAVADITAKLQAATGLTDTDLRTVLMQAAADPSAQVTGPTAPTTAVPETGETTAPPEGAVPLATGEEAAQDARLTNPSEAQQEITIVVEKDGVVTEVTARADDKGNLQAVKEVVATPVESAATQTDAGDSGEQSESQSGQNGAQEMAGRSSLLEQLLLNRTGNTETFNLNQAAPVMNLPDTEQIMRQIMDFMKIQVKPDINHLEMQLNPANLGKVYVEIAAKEGIITAQLTAQNETVKAALESQLVELKENLRAQGVKVEAVEVNVQSQSFDSNLWQGQDEADQGYQQNRRNHRRINLNELDLEELPEDMTGEEKLAAEIMVENGGTVDMQA